MVNTTQQPLHWLIPIISSHIETYRELLSNAFREDKREFMEGLKGTRQFGMEEESDESCQDNDLGQ